MTEMEGIFLEPDQYTYSAIVCALTNAGRTEEAKLFGLIDNCSLQKFDYLNLPFFLKN